MNVRQYQNAVATAVLRHRIGLVIPTLNAGEHWNACLEAIKSQSIRADRLLVVDSASTDATVCMAQAAGFEVIRIERSQFNHGGTRQWAADYLKDCDVIVFLTQDAILAADDSLENLVACFRDPVIATAYGRQIPHVGAGPIASHARSFNYGLKPVYKDLSAASSLGTKVFFSSNSFAAYSRHLLTRLGGFRRDLILGEDMEFAARAINAGYANMYCPSAIAHHSHEYTLTQTFKRYFDIGTFDSRVPWLRERFGSHGGEGKRFVISELRFLWALDRLAIPEAILQNTAKLVGYNLGRLQHRLPMVINRKLSMMPSFWK